MRDKVATRAGTHAFDESITKLPLLQLRILYDKALQKEKNEAKLKVEIHKSWREFFIDQFKLMRIFIDRDLYADILDKEKLDELRDEVKPEDYDKIMEEAFQFIPREFIIVEDENPLDGAPQADKEAQDFFAGIVSYKERLEKKEGEE